MTFDVIAAARRRTRRLVLVVAGTGAVICALVYPLGLYANSRLDDNAPTPPTATTPAQVSGSPATSAVAVVLPADTTWTTVAGVALPVSATAGPLRRDHGLAAGFAHTPAGAVLAAVHLLVNTTPQVGSAVFEPTLRTQVVGENAAAMRAAVEADYRQLGGDPVTGGPVGSLPAALAGVRMAAYSDAASQHRSAHRRGRRLRHRPVRRHAGRSGLDRLGLGAGRPARRPLGRRGRRGHPGAGCRLSAAGAGAVIGDVFPV